MVQGMTKQTTKAPAPARQRPGKRGKNAVRRLKKAWPAATALAVVAVVAGASIMASVPSVSASPVGVPTAPAAPNIQSTHIPGTGPAPALGTPFLVDAKANSVALVNVAKGTYQDGPARKLVLDVTWKQASGSSEPDPAVLKVTTAAGKTAPLVGQEAAEVAPGTFADQSVRYTYDVGAGDAKVTVTAKYTDKPTTFSVPS